ncbi:uncharacterized protein [Taeniopygia guttata]|uniref:uncharacterized protein isoform X1 n=1 Tax=Taeniopygia guttata TaxID=59729 RepID=UPI003BB99452
MGALGGMRRNVEVKARLREREAVLRAALRRRGLSTDCAGTGLGAPRECPGTGPGSGEEQEPPQDCPGTGHGAPRECPGTGQEPPQECPGTGHGAPRDCPGTGPGSGEGQEPPQGCPGTGPGSGEGQEPPQECPGTGQELPQDCPGAGQVLLQTDTFFHVPRGRLKLRRTQDGRGELIFYERPDRAGPKLSLFSTSPTADPEGLQAVLSQSLGVLGTVRKERLLLLLGQTRLHLDRVEGLGDFLELEVVLRPEQSEQDGQRVAQELLRDLGVADSDLVPGAYLDLLLALGDSGDSVLSQGQRG